jgi:hypothetical protein
MSTDGGFPRKKTENGGNDRYQLPNDAKFKHLTVSVETVSE